MVKFIERTHPYLIAFCVTALWFFFGKDLTQSNGFDNALDSMSTMCSILLGFVAAILPVVLSLRTKGNYIDKVIVNGGGLLRSYCVESIISGFILIAVNTLNYFRFDTRVLIKLILFYLWVFCVTVFIFCSIRSMYFLIRLILPNKTINPIPEESETEKKYKDSL